MAVRFRNEHASWAVTSPITWKIEIFDSTYGDEVTDFEVENGLDLQYRATGDDVNEPILASSARFSMVIQNSTHEQLITDLAGAKEGRFTVVLYKDDVFHWAGVINSPEISIEDADYPFGFEITAVDGLALLKNYEYKQNITSATKWTEVYEGQNNLVEIAARCLKKLPHVVTHFDGSSKFLVTAVNWYNANFPSTDVSDPLWLTYLDNRGFAQGQGTGAAKFNSCFEVLSFICGLFNARISLVDGYFLIEQIEHRAATIGAPANYSRYYDYDLTEPLANTLVDEQPIGNTEDVKKLRGGTYSFTPALRSARVKQQLNGLQNLIQGFQVSSDLPSTGYPVGTVFANPGSSGFPFTTFKSFIRLTGTIECGLGNVGMIAGTPQLALFKIRIELGGASAAKREGTTVGDDLWTYDPLTWDADLASRIFFFVKIDAPTVDETTTAQADINLLFPTPFDFTQGDLVFDFDFEALYFLGAEVDGSDYTLEWTLKNHYLDIISALTTPAKSVTYEVVGEEDNTEVLEYETIIGDKDSDIMNQWRGLLYFDDPDYYYTEPFWGNRNGTRDRPIVQLLAQRLIAARYFPRKILRGTAVGSAFVIQNPIEERGETYILKGGTYNTERDEMAGEWVKLAFTSAEFTYLDALYETGEYEATTPGGGTGGGNTPIDSGGGGTPDGVADGNGIYSDDGTTSATVTVDGVFTIQDNGADDAVSIDMGGGGAYIDSTTAQLTFDDGGNSHVISASASGILINAPSATADNVFVRAAGALVKLQDIGGSIQIGGGTTESEARFMEASGNGTNYAAVKSPASLSANVTLVLPPTSGTANQILGQNSGATGTEYKTVSGTTNQVTVTHGANSITLATPQNIHTGASPTFSSMTLTNDLTVNDDISMTGGGLQTFTMNGGTANLFQMNGVATMTIGNATADPQFYINGDDGYVGIEPNSSGNNIDIRKFTASGTAPADGQNIFLSINDGAALSNGHYIGSLYFRSRGSSTTLQTGGQISAIADGSDWTNTSLPTKLVFQTVPNGSAVLADVLTLRETKNAEFTGNVELTTTGAKVKVSTGSNASMGTATLSSGTVTVNTTAVATGSTIFLTCNTPGGTQGFLSAPSGSITNGTSFVINSSSGSDTSTVNWWIIN